MAFWEAYFYLVDDDDGLRCGLLGVCIMGLKEKKLGL